MWNLNDDFLPRAARAAGGMALVVLLAACGGGGGGPGNPPLAGAASYTSGAITGFGSVIVNGVRFNDDSAELVDDDGNRLARGDLALGQQVEIEASSIDRAGGLGVATRIRVGSELVGPVAAVDLPGRTLVLLGQTVVVDDRTVFDDSLAGGLAGVTAGQVLEIHAQLDAARGVYRASRIEPEDSPEAYQLRGLVQALDTAARSFRIGGATINYASASELPPNLANGQRVRVRLQPLPVAGQWVATRVTAGDHGHDDDFDEAEVEGLITAWVSATEFSVNGLPVDARNATFRDGQAGVVLGARVEVEGAIVNGVLVATQVHLEDEDDDGHEGEYELHGAIATLDTVARTFTLRGVVVAYSETTVFDGMAEADLAVGAEVEVKGTLSADGTRVDAIRIERED